MHSLKNYLLISVKVVFYGYMERGILKYYPVLKGESISNKKNKALYKNKEDIIQIIKNKKYIMISGERSMERQLY